MSAVATPEKVCQARAFRARHPGTRLSLVGYSSAPPDVEAEYLTLVTLTVERVGPWEQETHRCVCCDAVVFEAGHS